MRVLVIGLTRELPLSATDAMDIADMLVARAANAHTEGMCTSTCVHVYASMYSKFQLRLTVWCCVDFHGSIEDHSFSSHSLLFIHLRT